MAPTFTASVAIGAPIDPSTPGAVGGTLYCGCWAVAWPPHQSEVADANHPPTGPPIKLISGRVTFHRTDGVPPGRAPCPPAMSHDPAADRTTDPPPWIPAGSAVIGAFYAYFAVTVGFVPVGLLFRLDTAQSTDYGLVAVWGAVAVIVAAGLHLLARRYRSPQVQAGAVVGTAVMTLLVVAGIGLAPRVGVGATMLLLLVGLGVVITTFPLTAVATPRADERSGIDLLRASLEGWWRRLVGSDKPPADAGTDPTADTPRPAADRSRFARFSNYWLVVGTAFVVAIPIALVETDLGIGLLSAFLTAYAVSQQIDSEAEDEGDGD